jgi:ATP-binding cassette subfamily B protein
LQDFIETEDVVREYDSKIIRRIFRYIKRYKGLVCITLLALLVSTLGELVVPILEQRLIDDAIMPAFLRVDKANIENSNLEAASKTELERMIKHSLTIEIGDYFFVPEKREIGLTAKEKKKLESALILDSERWYTFARQSSNGSRDSGEVIARYPLLFYHDANNAALKSADLAQLAVGDREIIRKNDIHQIIIVCIGLLMVLAIVFAATFGQIVAASLVGQKVMKDMRIELFTHTASLSTGFLSDNPVGRIVSRLTGDVETINEFFTSVIVALLKDLSLMAGVLITLFYLAPKLALVVLICIPPVVIAAQFCRKKARDAFRRQRIASSAINSYTSEHLSLLSVVQLFRREKKTEKEFNERNNELLHANIDEMFVYATFRPIVEFLSVLTSAAVIVAGAIFVLDLSLSLGILVAFINLVALFYSPVMDISEKYTILQSAMAGGERVFDLLDKNEKIIDDAPPRDNEIEGDIEFKNVSFCYKKDEPVINDLSFKVARGEQVAIVGYTGAGKTTITNILARLWDIDSGEITIDGISIKDIPLKTLRRSVLPVLQDVFLFSGTIAENISLGLPLSEEAIRAAARTVHADTFIEKLSSGYNTVLSEGAVNISHGEKQLISFARVIAHNPKVVILDEATSSIDTETERLLQEGMAKVLNGRTSIVIAHRLSTIRGADRILVLSGGALAEEGSHAELLAKGGIYSLLCKLQFEIEAAPR